MVGIRLIVEVLDHAPAELTPQERLLLVALAEAARDDTRMCWPGMETLTRRMGLSARTVREVLAGLAQRGYDVRIPAGTDKNGKPTYTHTGRATTYRLPRFPRRRHDPAALEAAEFRHLHEGKAAESGTERRRNHVEEAAESRPPSPHEPSENPQIIRARADDEIAAVIEALRDRTGKTVNEHHAALVVKQLVDGRDSIRDRVKYLIGAIAKDPDPARFLPTPSPPPYRREDY